MNTQDIYYVIEYQDPAFDQWYPCQDPEMMCQLRYGMADVARTFAQNFTARFGGIKTRVIKHTTIIEELV